MSPPVAQSERATRSRRAASSRGPNSAAKAGPPTTRRHFWRIAWIVALALVVLLFLAVAERAVYSGKVMPGVDVDGVDLAGDKELAAYAAVKDLATKLEHEPLRVKVRGKELSADPTLIRLDIDEAATLRAARTAGRSRNPVEQVTGTLLRRFRSDHVPLVVHYDEQRLAGVLDGWGNSTTEGMVEGGLRFEGANVVPIEPRAGEGILRAEAIKRIEDGLARAERSVVTLPVGRVQPAIDRAAVDRAAAQAREMLTGTHVIAMAPLEVAISPAQLAVAMGTRIVDKRLELTVDPAKLRFALGPNLAPLEVVPVDASFTVTPQNTVQVVPSQTGRTIDMDVVAKEILAGNRRITARPRAVVPAHDTKWAEGLGITHQVSSFTTNHPAGQPRVHNIHLAADVLNNTIVEPGQVFSLNDKLGKRTPEKGYVKAPVIGDGEFVEDYGGGVSQLTTTLYNAVFFGGYEDVEHTPHSIYISRYPMGREATINFGVTDLKFRNDTSHGVLIRTGYSNTSITVSFYGDNEGRTVREEDRKVLGEEPITDEVIPCPADPDVDKNNDCAHLTLFQQKKIEDGHTGYTVQFTRVIDQPGKPQVRRQYRFRYRMFKNKILVGTTVPAPPPPPATTPTTAAPPATVAPASPTTTVAPPPPT
jgi:vancomycin resistance protein YoaR